MFFCSPGCSCAVRDCRKRSERGPSKLGPAIAAPVIVIAALCMAGTLHAQSPRKLTLSEAVDLALKQNSNLRIDRAKVREINIARRGRMRTNFRKSKQTPGCSKSRRTQNLTIPAGSLGAYPGLVLLPGSTVLINQGNHNFFIANTTSSSL